MIKFRRGGIDTDELNIDFEGLLFDYKEYKQHWPKFWEEGGGFRLTALAFCEREPGTKIFQYMDFIETFKKDFEFEIGPCKYSFLSFGQKQYRKNTETAINRIFSAKPCTLEQDPIKKYGKRIK